MELRIFSPARLGAVFISMLMLAPVLAGAQTNALKLVKGTVSSSATGSPVDGGRVAVYQGSNSEPVTTSKINPRTGFYQVILSPGIDYRFEVVSPKFYRTNITVKTPSGTNYEEIVKDLKVEPIPMGVTLYSGNLFDPGAATLKEDSKLRGVLDVLKKESSMAVTISVVPEMAPAAGKKAAPKKGKKGKGVAEQVVETPTMDFTQIGNARVAALKNYFKSNGISTTRLKWDVRPGITVQGGKKKGADNVTIKISGIQADEEEADS